MKPENLYTLPIWDKKDEFVETILKTKSLRVERIISSGHTSENGFWYCQEENELVFLLQGEAKIEFSDGSIVSLKAGDYINIEKEVKHRVAFTSKEPETIWLAVFYQ